MKNILIRTHFTNWHKVTKQQAIDFVRFMLDKMTTTNKVEQINSKYLKGTTVQELLKMQRTHKK